MTGQARYDHPNLTMVDADPITKIGVLADYVAAIYHQFNAARATQLIYCEIVMVYDEIRRELLARGIVAEEIAYIQDFTSKAQKASLFRAVNTGQIRVLLASKQSTGMNIQQRLIALHHLDCPWRPGDLEQREGRIVRQGNSWPEVMVFAYVTEHSFDGYKWQTIETKAGFIEQMKRGDVTVRQIDDLGDAVLSAAEIKALASGNPLVMEKVKLEMTIQQLEASAAADRSNRIRMRQQLVSHEQTRTTLRSRTIPRLETAMQIAAHHHGQEFAAAIINGVMQSDATSYTKRDAAGEAVLKVLHEVEARAQLRQQRQVHTIGHYRGFVLVAIAYTVGMSELLVQCEHAGEYVPISAQSVTLRTASGVFQSIDHQIGALASSIAEHHATIQHLDTEDAKIQAVLARAWPHTDELHLAYERMHQLNTALTRSGSPGACDRPNDPSASPTDGSTPDMAIRIIADDERELQNDAVHTPSPDMTRPIVLLPEPNDALAMATAMQMLSAPGNDAIEPEQIALESSDASEAIDEYAIALPCADTAETEVLDACASIPLRLTAPAPDPATRTRPIFGQPISNPPARRAVKNPRVLVMTIRQLGMFEHQHASAPHDESMPIPRTATPVQVSFL